MISPHPHPTTSLNAFPTTTCLLTPLLLHVFLVVPQSARMLQPQGLHLASSSLRYLTPPLSYFRQFRCHLSKRSYLTTHPTPSPEFSITYLHSSYHLLAYCVYLFIFCVLSPPQRYKLHDYKGLVCLIITLS